MSIKKRFPKGFEKSSACMTRQKGYCLLKEESLFHVPFPLCFRVQCWGLHQFSSPCHLSPPPALPLCPFRSLAADIPGERRAAPALPPSGREPGGERPPLQGWEDTMWGSAPDLQEVEKTNTN